MKRSIQRWRWIARAHDSRRPRGIVDRWAERGFCEHLQEWERRAALAGVRPLPPSPRIDRAIDAFAGRREAIRAAARRLGAFLQASR